MYKVLTFLVLNLFVLIPRTLALDTEGLVGAWLFDEGKGQAVTDSSDNGLDGEIAQRGVTSKHKRTAKPQEALRRMNAQLCPN